MMNLILSAIGLFIIFAILGLIFRTLIAPKTEEDAIVVVLLSTVAIGFGASLFYYSAQTVLRLVG